MWHLFSLLPIVLQRMAAVGRYGLQNTPLRERLIPRVLGGSRWTLRPSSLNHPGDVEEFRTSEGHVRAKGKVGVTFPHVHASTPSPFSISRALWALVVVFGVVTAVFLSNALYREIQGEYVG